MIYDETKWAWRHERANRRLIRQWDNIMARVRRSHTEHVYQSGIVINLSLYPLFWYCVGDKAGNVKW